MTKVLICEDEALVALDLQMTLEDAGFDVVGSYPSVSKAMSALALMKPDLAVLDVRLADGEVFPVADQLKQRGVGIVFHSGHLVKGDITNTFPGAECCMKPVAPGTIDCSSQAAANPRSGSPRLNLKIVRSSFQGPGYDLLRSYLGPTLAT